ncbi:hypothetical protein [Tautonia sociabilis]|nr:hypothetical protein [Tautonia sociabilis]
MLSARLTYLMGGPKRSELALDGFLHRLGLYVVTHNAGKLRLLDGCMS